MGLHSVNRPVRRASRALRWFGALVVLAALSVPFSVGAEHEGYHWEVYLGGLQTPRGLDIDADGDLIVAQLGDGSGFTGRITHVWEMTNPDTGAWSVLSKDLVNTLPSTVFNPEAGELIGPSDAVVSADGSVHFVTGGPFFSDPYWPSYQALWSAPNDNHAPLQTAAPYAWFFPYEIEHDPDGEGPDSNPYSLELDADGNAYVNDSGANATYMVTADGTITTYAVYPSFPNPTDIGPPMVNQVPTGMAWGPDGALYVSTLTGFPFLQGAAVVYRLEDLDGDGDVLEEGEMEVYADGLTTSTAIAFDDDGNLYATQFNGFLKGEAPNTGDVVMWEDGEWHTVISGLSTPTGLAIGHDGTIYVSQEFFGQVLRIWQD